MNHCITAFRAFGPVTGQAHSCTRATIARRACWQDPTARRNPCDTGLHSWFRPVLIHILPLELAPQRIKHLKGFNGGITQASLCLGAASSNIYNRVSWLTSPHAPANHRRATGAQSVGAKILKPLQHTLARHRPSYRKAHCH